MHAARLARIWVLALSLGCWMLVAPLWAGQAHLVEVSDVDRVVVETSDAGVDEVLAALAAHFGFAVERSAPTGQTVRFSGRLAGSLDQLLERLLRHEGHVIVRSAEARAGISRVVLMEARPADKSGAPPAPALAGPIAAIKARLGLKEGAAGK